MNRNDLWETLGKYDVKGQALDNIVAMYANSVSAVRTPSGLSNRFRITSRVRQGCVLSPLLLILYTNLITEANPDPEILNELLFAEDQGLANKDKAQLQKHTDSRNNTCKKYYMKISIWKTEVMSVGRSLDKLEIKIGGSRLQQTTEFKYLGSIFTEDRRLEREIETRTQKTSAGS